MNFSDQIRSKAGEIGFAKTGIVAASALDAETGHFREWLALGFQGEMAWLERNVEKRSDPRVLFPGAKSIVVVAQNYYTSHKHGEEVEKGKISRYAWGDDYHDVLREKLNTLLDWIKEQKPDVHGKICVDTTPFMDKAWAVRAK